MTRKWAQKGGWGRFRSTNEREMLTKCGRNVGLGAVLEGLAGCLPALTQRGGRVPTRFQPPRRWLTAFPFHWRPVAGAIGALRLTFSVFYQATFALFCTLKDTCHAFPQSQPLALSATTRSQKVKVKKIKNASPCSDKCRLLKLLGNFSQSLPFCFFCFLRRRVSLPI